MALTSFDTFLSEFIDCSPGLQCRLRGMKTGVVDRNLLIVPQVSDAAYADTETWVVGHGHGHGLGHGNSE